MLKIKVPSVNVRSVEDYFNLPKSERTYFGLYKLPIALPFSFDDYKVGWTFFYNKIKKEFPVQYFFRHWLFGFDNPLTLTIYKFIIWPGQNLRYGIKNFLNPSFKSWRKVLPRHRYADADQVFVESNLALLKDFYNEQVLTSYIDWDSNENLKNFRNELESHIHWIEVESKKIDSEIGELLKDYGKDKTKHKTIFDKQTKLEESKEKKITKIIKWMADNRQNFWV